MILPILSFSQENIKYSNTININDLYDHIEILASDSLRKSIALDHIAYACSVFFTSSSNPPWSSTLHCVSLRESRVPDCTGSCPRATP